MQSERAFAEKMRVQNYRFVFIGSIVSIFILYIISFKVIIYASILLVFLFGVWNFRYELGIQRRLLQAGLVLGLVPKSNRSSRNTSNLKSKNKIFNTNNKDSSLRHETFSDALVLRKSEKENSGKYDISKSAVPISSFVSPQAFVFGSPRASTCNSSLERLRRSFQQTATSPLFQRSLLVQEQDNFEYDSQDQSSVGYIFQPTRRILSVNRHYPTHQTKYAQLGVFPSIHLKPSPIPVLNSKAAMGQHTPVTIRIAPPRNFTPSPIKLSYSASPTPLKGDHEPDPCDAKTVIAALKENSRKRLRRDEKVEWDPKRQRCDSSTNSSSSLGISNPGDLEHLHPMEEGDLDNCQQVSGKRPATPGPLASPSPALGQKRHKNNAILSSYSSTKRTAMQLTEISPPSKKHVRMAPLSKDRFCQTESPLMGRSDVIETPIANRATEITSGPSAMEPVATSSVETPSLLKKSPFPALKEGFSPRQNISFYADIGKSSTFVYNMPEYLPTLEDYQHDRKIEEQRLNHLLFGTRKPTTDNISNTEKEKTSVSEPMKSGFSFNSGFITTENTTPITTILNESMTPESIVPPPPYNGGFVTEESTTISATTVASGVTPSETTSSLPQLNSSSTIASTLPSASTPFASGQSLTHAELTTAETVTSTSITSPNFFSNSQRQNLLTSSKPTAPSITESIATGTIPNVLVSGALPSVLSSGILSNALASGNVPSSNKDTSQQNVTTSVSDTFNTFFTSPVPAVITTSTSTPNTQTSASSSMNPLLVNQPINMNLSKNSVTILTTATTTQTSIPTFSSFSSSQSNLKESPFRTSLSTSAFPNNLTSQPTPTTSISSTSISSNGIQSLFSPITTSVATNTLSSFFAVPPSLSQSNPMTGASLNVNASTLAPTNMVSIGTTNVNSLFPLSAKPSTLDLASTQKSSLGPTPNAINKSIFSNADSVFGQSSDGTFSLNTANSSTQPKLGFEMPSSKPSNIFGASTQPNNVFGVAQQQQSSVFGTSTQPSSIFNAFAPPAQPSTAFGVTSQPNITFGVSSQPNTFPTSTQSGNVFGGMQKPNIFGASSQSNTTISVSTQPSNSFSVPSQTLSSFGVPAGGSVFGQFPSTVSTFPVSTQATPAFGLSAQPNPGFGLSTQPSSTFGASTRPTASFGGITTQANTFGSLMSTPDLFGGSAASQNKFPIVSDTKTNFLSTNSPAFGSQNNQFGGSFGNTPSTAIGTFSAGGGQPSVFGDAKVFGNSSTGSANPTFNPPVTSSLNFNFSTKPTFNFSTTEPAAFGAMAPPSQQAFVFTGAPNPTPVVNAVGPANNFFSIGAGPRERKVATARKRIPRK